MLSSGKIAIREQLFLILATANIRAAIKSSVLLGKVHFCLPLSSAFLKTGVDFLQVNLTEQANVMLLSFGSAAAGR